MIVKTLSDFIAINDCSLLSKSIKYGYVVIAKSSCDNILNDNQFIGFYKRYGDKYIFVDSFFMTEAEFMIHICLEHGIGSSEIVKLSK